MTNPILDNLDLNETEKKAVLDILKEISEKGTSQKMDNLLLEDYFKYIFEIIKKRGQ